MFRAYRSSERAMRLSCSCAIVRTAPTRLLALARESTTSSITLQYRTHPVSAWWTPRQARYRNALLRQRLRWKVLSQRSGSWRDEKALSCRTTVCVGIIGLGARARICDVEIALCGWRHRRAQMEGISGHVEDESEAGT